MLLFDFMEYKQATWKDQVRRFGISEERKEAAYKAIDAYFDRKMFNPDVNTDISNFHCVQSFEFRHEMSEDDKLVDTPCGVTCPFCEKYQNWCSHCPYITYYGCVPMSPYSDMMTAIDLVNWEIKNVRG